jgi:prefoldin subunit 5
MSMRSKEADEMLVVLVRIAEAIESIKQQLEEISATAESLRQDQWDIPKAIRGEAPGQTSY